MGGNAIAVASNNTCWHPAPDTKKFSDTELREGWQAEIIPFPKRPLAKIADVNVECVRLWKAGDRLPSLTNAANISQAIPSVQAWAVAVFGHVCKPQELSLDEIIMALHQVAACNTPDGARARQLLAANYALNSIPEHAADTVGRLAMQTIDRKMRGEA